MNIRGATYILCDPSSRRCERLRQDWVGDTLSSWSPGVRFCTWAHVAICLVTFLDIICWGLGMPQVRTLEAEEVL